MGRAIREDKIKKRILSRPGKRILIKAYAAGRDTNTDRAVDEAATIRLLRKYLGNSVFLHTWR